MKFVKFVKCRRLVVGRRGRDDLEFNLPGVEVRDLRSRAMNLRLIVPMELLYLKASASDHKEKCGAMSC